MLRIDLCFGCCMERFIYVRICCMGHIIHVHIYFGCSILRFIHIHICFLMFGSFIRALRMLYGPYNPLTYMLNVECLVSPIFIYVLDVVWVVPFIFRMLYCAIR